MGASDYPPVQQAVQQKPPGRRLRLAGLSCSWAASKRSLCHFLVLCTVVGAVAFTFRGVFWRSCIAAVGVTCKSCPPPCDGSFGPALGVETLPSFKALASRTLFVVITGSPNHQGRAKSMRETWLSLVPCFAIYSDAEDKELGIVGLPGTTNDYNGSQRKWSKAMTHVWKRQRTAEGTKGLCPNLASVAEPQQPASSSSSPSSSSSSSSSFDWLVFVDDDTFVWLPHLYRELAAHDPSVPLALGSTDAPDTRAGGLVGGSGMAMSSSLVEALLHNDLLQRCDDLYLVNSDAVMMSCIRGMVPNSILEQKERERQEAEAAAEAAAKRSGNGGGDYFSSFSSWWSNSPVGGVFSKPPQGSSAPGSAEGAGAAPSPSPSPAALVAPGGGAFGALSRFPVPVIFDVCGFAECDLNNYLNEKMDPHFGSRDLRYMISLHLHGDGGPMREMFRLFYGTGNGTGQEGGGGGGGLASVADRLQPCPA